jgi:hypothetical protein
MVHSYAVATSAECLAKSGKFSTIAKVTFTAGSDTSTASNKVRINLHLDSIQLFPVVGVVGPLSKMSGEDCNK